LFNIQERCLTYLTPFWAPNCKASILKRKNSWASSCLPRRKLGAIST
jgi:hypothetical protein